jgi:hypothetical protein
VPQESSPLPPGAIRTAWVLFLTSALFFALLGRGTLFSPDESGIFNTGVHLTLKNSLASDRNQQDVHPGKDGQHYSHREILPILMTLPTITLGLAIDVRVRPVGPPVAPAAVPFNQVLGTSGTNWLIFVTTLVLGPVLIAGVVTLVYLFALRSGAAAGLALSLALAAGLSTPLVVYAKTIFPQVQESLFLMLALYRAEQFRRSGADRAALNVGLACGLGMMSRSFFFLVAFYFFLYVLATARPGPRLRAAFTCAVPMAVAGVVVGYVNWLRWGNPFDFGHHGSHERFSSNPALGVLGLLFSPGKGLFVFAPVLWLAVVGYPKLWRHGWHEVVLMTAITLSYLGVYGSWYDWPGGLSWGPRFLLPVMAPWIAILSRLAKGRLARPAVIAFVALAVIGFVVQIPGVLVNPHQMDELRSSPWSLSHNHLVALWRQLMTTGPDDLWILTGKGTSAYWRTIGASLAFAFVAFLLFLALLMRRPSATQAQG